MTNDVVVKMSRMRRLIAKRMHESLSQTAQLTLVSTADVTAFIDFRSSWTEGRKPSFTDAVIRASALALRNHPGINSRVEGDAVVHIGDVNIGMAVALDAGLIVPVIRDANRLTLGELAPVTHELATRAREGKLGFPDLEGGTFTVTSLGGQGIDAFTPVLNPPESAILGVGRARPVATPSEGGIQWRQEMTLSLTIDHRIIDGYQGALFLADVAHLLSEPDSL